MVFVQKSILLVMVICIGFLYKAQLPLNHKAYHDSLYTALQTQRNDSAKARISFQLAHYWAVKRDQKKAEKYLAAGRSYFRNNRFLLGIYYSTVIEVYLDTDPVKTRSALHKADSLLSAFHTPDAYYTLARSWYSEAINAQKANDEKKALEIIVNKVIPLIKKSGKKDSLAMFYSQVGILLMNSDQMESAEEYFERIISMKNSLPANSNIVLRAYIYSGEAFTYRKKLPQAKARLDEAWKILVKNPGSSDYGDYYKVTGNYYEKAGQYDEAVHYYDKGIEVAKNINDTYLEGDLIRYRLGLLIETKQYEPAKKMLGQVMLNTRYMVDLDNRKEVYEQMARVSYALGQDSEAYRWQIKYSALSDSLHIARSDEDIAEIEAKFKNAEKAKTIAQLQADKKQSELNHKNQKLTNWILGITVMALLTGIFFLTYYYKSARKLAVQKEINHEQHLKEIENQHQLKLVQAMLGAEERERQRIGRDLHDGLGGMLAGIKMNLSQQAQSEYHNLNTVISRLDESVTELRRIARNMMPESLVKIGLETALHDLCELLQNEDTQIEFQAINVDEKISDPAQMHIYRIIQELLSNAVRHAQPSNIMLQCSQNQSRFYITVEDDGTGFDTGMLSESPGIGFSNIRNRVAYMNGTMEITSAENEGTTVNIELDLNQEAG
jgi:signal transduction histidine kinase